LCKCKISFYGVNCEKSNKAVQYVKSEGNVMTPFVISFGAGYGIIYIIGFTIIYCYFEKCKEKKQNNNEQTEQKSKIYFEKEYQLTQNKVLDIEANIEMSEKVRDEANKNDIKNDIRTVNNSYQLVGKNDDRELNSGGMVKTEEIKIIPKTTENNDIKL